MSSLHVVWEGVDEQGVQRQLQELDPRLFLDKEADPNGRVFYVAKYHEHGFNEPQVVLDWREPNGTPKPLSSGVVYEIQKMMRQGGVDVKGIIRRNEERKSRRDEEMLGVYEDMAKEFDRAKRIGNFAIVPRSQGLRMSRDKQRAKGRKV